MNQDELILRYLQGRISSREEETLRVWRDENQANERRYQEFAAIWRATRCISEMPSSQSPPVQVVTSEAARRRRISGSWPLSSWQVAALVMALMIGGASAGFWAALMLSEGDGNGDLGAAGEIVTGVNETSTARLSDGTVIRLAPESRLVLPALPGDREVTLDGKAFFAVAADPDNPFWVRTPAGKARVLGTRFELDARQDRLRLLVVEGRVVLTANRSEVDVRSNQLTHMRSGEEPLTVEIEDIWSHLGWMGDFLAFESTPLSEVRSELQRRFDVELEFMDPSLADESVTVWFGDEGLEEVVFVLCRLVGTSCSMNSSRVRMTRRQ